MVPVRRLPRLNRYYPLALVRRWLRWNRLNRLLRLVLYLRLLRLSRFFRLPRLVPDHLWLRLLPLSR